MSSKNLQKSLQDISQTTSHNASQTRIKHITNKILHYFNTAFFWLAFGFCSFALVVISHLFFQGYLFMQPCEQCVYIRYAFIIMGLGGIFLGFGYLLQDERFSALCKVLGFVVGLYGSIKGIVLSFLLLKVHRALNATEADFSMNIFGLQGCSMEARFDFGLPLSEWFPSVFMPTGDCGQDFALPPSDIVLSPLRAYFVDLYSQGWYLLPSAKFGSMAECCLAVFGVGIIAFGVLFMRHFLALLFRAIFFH